MYLILILALAVLFPATHILNGWLFEFATINHHISLIYLPAFLRLTNLLVLGPVYGTLTTVLGGLLLIGNFEETLGLAMLNIACSSASPLIALMGFRIYFNRRVQLSNLRDLATLTLIYCICNSVIHHAVWLVASWKNAALIFQALRSPKTKNHQRQANRKGGTDAKVFCNPP
ncbi:MAG: hypothetical protein RIS72_1644 [Pseudomonadota bacterium]